MVPVVSTTGSPRPTCRPGPRHRHRARQRRCRGRPLFFYRTDRHDRLAIDFVEHLGDTGVDGRQATDQADITGDNANGLTGFDAGGAQEIAGSQAKDCLLYTSPSPRD